MIVWSRFGFLTFFIGILTVGAINSLLSGVPHHTAIGLLLAAVINWFVGKKLNSGEGRILRDENTGEVFQIKNRHTFFWLQMEWWSIGFALFAMYLFFTAP